MSRPLISSLVGWLFALVVIFTTSCNWAESWLSKLLKELVGELSKLLKELVGEFSKLLNELTGDGSPNVGMPTRFPGIWSGHSGYIGKHEASPSPNI